MHIVDMNSSLRSIGAAKNQHDPSSHSHSGSGATSLADNSATEVTSVAKLRGWLDDFGKQQQQHHKKHATAKEQLPPKETSPTPMFPSQVRQKGQWSSARPPASTVHKKTIVPSTPACILTASKPKIPAAQVQATNEGYASVKQLSQWLAQDPTSTSKPKHLRRGMNVIQKSRAFDKGLEDFILQDAKIVPGAVTQVKRTFQSQNNNSSNNNNKHADEQWETSSLVCDKTEEPTKLPVSSAATDIACSSASHSAVKAKDMWRMRSGITPPRASRFTQNSPVPPKNTASTNWGRASWSGTPAQMEELDILEATHQNDDQELVKLFDEQMSFVPEPFNIMTISPNPPPSVSPYRTAARSASKTPTRLVRSSSFRDAAAKFSSSSNNSNVNVNHSMTDVHCSPLQPKAIADTYDCPSVNKSPVKSSNSKHVAEDSEQTLETCASTAENSTSTCTDPSIIMTSSTLTSLPDADVSYQLTDKENVGTAADGVVSQKVDTSSHPLVAPLRIAAKVPPKPLMYTHRASMAIATPSKTTPWAVGGTSSGPKLPSETLDISSLRSGLKPRSDKTEKDLEIDDEMGPVGFHAARASFLARINPPPPPEVEPEDDDGDDNNDDDDLNKPVDFRKARDILVKRSKKNGNDVEVVSKVNRRKALFERESRRRRESSIGSMSSSDYQLERPSWQASAGMNGHFEKTLVAKAVASKKTLQQLP